MCCAPCATYCLTRILDCFDVTLFYSNDNITDPTEWQKRLTEAERLVKTVNNGEFEVVPKFPLKLEVKEFDGNRFFEVAQGLENEPEGGARCKQCFAMRLGDTLDFARKNSFDFFGTTLTVSPYKNSRLLNEIGIELAQQNILTAPNDTKSPICRPQWLPSDFKKRGGYNESIRLCAKYEIYRQHYCGCVFSFRQ